MQAADELNGPCALRVGLRPVARLVGALADPARRERTLLIVLAAYVVIWTLYGVLAKASQDMQVDAAELVAWAHHPALGYAKHPPLAAWVVGAWFWLFPVHDWSYYLLAIAYATVGLWVAWHLYRHFLDAEKRIVALACLTFLPYFNFLGLRFDHNAVLGPLWAVTALAFIRSFETRNASWAALAGAAAAAAMLGKYWSIFLLAGLAVAALLDSRRTIYFRSTAPWITIAVGALLLAPHIVWLVQHDFMPLTYAVGAHIVTTFTDTLVTAGRYLAGGLGYAAVPALVVLVAGRPSLAALADTVLPRAPERRFVVVAFWTTLLLPAVVGPVLDVDLNPIWTMPGLILLPVILLSSPLLVMRRQAVTAITALAVALPFVMLIAAPIIAVAIHMAGPDPVSAHAKFLAEHAEQEWRRITNRPLRIVGGDFGIANATAFYVPGQASSYPVLEPETAPWVTPERIARDGAVMVCNLVKEEHACTFVIQQAIDKAIAGNPPPRHVEVTLTRSFWGIPGKSQRWLILLVPPR
jgi:4-amino-4-deoxy-L-arabinose transferase-like glycosyltransferase